MNILKTTLFRVFAGILALAPLSGCVSVYETSRAEDLFRAMPANKVVPEEIHTLSLVYSVGSGAEEETVEFRMKNGKLLRMDSRKGQNACSFLFRDGRVYLQTKAGGPSEVISDPELADMFRFFLAWNFRPVEDLASRVALRTGAESVDGRACHVFDLTFKPGMGIPALTLWADAEDLHIRKLSYTRPGEGAPVSVLWESMEEKDGVSVPRALVLNFFGTERKMILKDCKVNIPLDDDIFEPAREKSLPPASSK